MYSILKQYLPGTQIWVLQLTPDDPTYTYDTLQEAEDNFDTVQALYPNNVCKISNQISS